VAASDATLVAELSGEFPLAVVEKDHGRSGPWVRAILAHLSGRTPRLDLPLDVQATAFQWQVWRALMAIPLRRDAVVWRARQIHRPTVGCPRRWPRVPPTRCPSPFRVTGPSRSVGALNGYRWGLARKKALLDLEQRGGPPK
jgi:AraC family transcriptional regulator of adaptative response/methylated-DNA-[protein]-cysteine methyltransferase